MNKKADVDIVWCGCPSILKCAYQLHHLYFNKSEKKKREKKHAKNSKKQTMSTLFLNLHSTDGIFYMVLRERQRKGEKLCFLEANFDRKTTFLFDLHCLRMFDIDWFRNF